jgi:hypothetical protein
MRPLTREAKAKLGAMLLKISRGACGYSSEEWELGRVLEGKGLAQFIGPDPGPKIMPIAEFAKQAQLAALSHFVITGQGTGVDLTTS